MKLRSYLLAAAAALALVGCGGGSGGGTATVPLSGTAAVGTPLAGATVELRDAVGTNVDLSTTADASGRFTFADVSGLTPPFMLRATGTVAGRQHILYSFSQTLPTSGVLNATPLTNAVVQAALPSGQTLERAFAAPSLNDTAVRSAELDRAMTQLNAALRDVFVALNIRAGADPFTTAFAADHTGLDRLLDLIEFHAEAGELRVAEKGNPQRAITVSVAANALPPTPLAAPVAADVDLTLLPRFVERVNAWLGDANRTRAGFDALVHEDFLDYGENRDLARTFFTTELLRPGFNVRIASYTVDGCQARQAPNASQIVCDLSFGLEYRNTATAPLRQDSIEIPAIFVPDAVQPWRLFGNQMPFSADFWPVVSYHGVDNVLVGFNFNVPVVQPGNRTAVGARIEFIDVSSGAGVALGQFHLFRSGFVECEYLATSTDNCSNAFLQSHQSNPVDIEAANRLQRAGHLQARMTVTYSDNVVSQPYVFLVSQPFFTLETGRAAATEAMRSFNLQGLGTPTIRFSGGNIDHLQIWYGFSVHVATDWSEVQALNGSFTAPESANIMHVFAVASDARDRKIWFSRSAPPPTTPPPTTQPPPPGAVTPPTTPPVAGTRLDWTPPVAPAANAVNNITVAGNLSYRFFDNLGNTQIWQASSGTTSANSGELAFAPAYAVGGESLRVVYSDLDVITDRWKTDFFRGTTPSNGFTDGVGNALVWCDGTGFAATRVLLSHNVQLSNLATLQTALSGFAANAEARTFDAMDCGHALLRNGGHRETLTVNSDGTATHRGGAADPLVLGSSQLAALLGAGFNDAGDSFIARIYRLDLQDGFPPIFYILLHGEEAGQQSLTLYVQR